MESNQNQGIFLNGKNQVIELLRHLSDDHRAKLLKDIGTRNPKLAAELIKKCITFSELYQLNDQALSLLYSSFSPSLIGLALKTSPPAFQRRSLKLMGRNAAEEAFEQMSSVIQNEHAHIIKAQKKILDAISGIDID